MLRRRYPATIRVGKLERTRRVQCSTRVFRRCETDRVVGMARGGGMRQPAHVAAIGGATDKLLLAVRSAVTVNPGEVATELSAVLRLFVVLFVVVQDAGRRFVTRDRKTPP